MPEMLVEYRLRIRSADNLSDALEVTSVRGGTNPYISEDGIPSGDGASFDPVTGVVTSGSFSLRIVDPITSGTSRLFTSLLEDADGRQQLGHRRAFLEFREDGGAWQTLYAGRLTRYALASDIEWEIAVGDFMRAEHDHKAFGQKADPTQDDQLEPFADYLARWPNRGCLLGGPILGGFLHIPDLGGWQFRIGEQGGVTGYTWTRFDFVSGYDAVGEAVPRGDRLDQVRDAINAAAAPYWEADYSNSPFGSFPDIRILLVNGASYDVYEPARYVGDVTAYRTPRSLLSVAVRVSRCSFWLPGTVGTVGDIKRVHIITRAVSDISAIYWTGHPVDLVAKLQGPDEADMPFDAAGIATVRNALGRGARFSLEVTAPQNVGAFLEQAVYGPWGVGARSNSDGEIALFNGRIIVTNALPSVTITEADVAEDSTRAFDLDPSNAIRTVHVEHTRLVQPMVGSYFGVDLPDPAFKHSSIKPLVQQKERFERTNADPGVIGTGEVTYTIPGMVHFSVPAKVIERIDTQKWASARAAEIFDRYGRGLIRLKTTILRTSPAMSAKLGDEILVDLPQLPNANKRLIDDPTVSARAMQIVHLTPTLIGHEIECVDSGPNAQPVATIPTHTITKSTGAPRSIAELTITNAATLNAASIAVRVQIAVTSGAAPDPEDYTDVLYFWPGELPTTAFLLPPVSAGSTVYARARSEQAVSRPSDWSTAVSVALDALDAPSLIVVTTDATDPSIAQVAFTPGANAGDAVTDVYLALLPDPTPDYALVTTLPPGSDRYTLYDLTGATDYVLALQHRDETTGGVSALVTEPFSTDALTPVVLSAPVNPDGFSFPFRAPGRAFNRPAEGNVTRYGIAVIAVDATADVEVAEAIEDSPGAGTYGSFITAGRVPSTSGDWTVWFGVAPIDGLRRKLKARHVRDGTTASAYTDEVIVTPGSTDAIAPFPIGSNTPHGTVSIAEDGVVDVEVDGPSWVASYKYITSTTAFPTEASVKSTGTTVAGQSFDLTGAATLAFAGTFFMTLVPYSGASATGFTGPPIRLWASFQSYTATKTVIWSLRAFLPGSGTLTFTSDNNARVSAGAFPASASAALWPVLPAGNALTQMATLCFTKLGTTTASKIATRMSTGIGSDTALVVADNDSVHNTGWQLATDDLTGGGLLTSSDLTINCTLTAESAADDAEAAYVSLTYETDRPDRTL